MKTGTLKKVLLWLVIAFVIVSIWNNPVDSANAAGDFLGSIGGFFADIIDKTSLFLRNLGGGDDTSVTTPSP